MKKLKLFSVLMCLFIGIGQMWGTVSWTRVTDVSDLTSGGTFIIGYEATANSGVIIPMANTGSASTTAAGFIYSGSTASSGGSGTINMSTVTATSNYEVTIVSSGEGKIAIKLGTNFLGNANTKNNAKLFTADAAANGTSLTPTIGTNNVVTLKNANATYHTLQYNNGSPRFAFYGGGQKNLVIYKKSESGPAQPAPSLDHIAITGTPSKTYEQGQSFDPTGLTVTAYYDDDTDADVTDDVVWSFDPATFTVAGENKSVTATATYEGEEDSETYNNITVTEHVVTPGEYTINLTNTLFGTTVNTNISSAINASQNDIALTVNGTGQTKPRTDATYLRFYTSSTLSLSVPTGYEITSIVITPNSTSDYSNPTTTIGEFDNDNKTWSGNASEVVLSFSAKSFIKSVTVTYAAVDMSKPATPEFSVAAGVYTEAQSVELSCTTGGATIYYTTDGSTPDNTSTEYTGSAISLSERGTYTIKAIAIKGEDASAVASATYTINLPYVFASVSELFTYLDENSLTTLNDVTVTGYVSEIVTEYSTQHSNISFNISDDGSTTAAQLQSYRGKGTDASSIEVGDKVTISGNYKVFYSTKELDQNNTITNRIAKGAVTSVAVSGNATKTTYSANETFETAGLVVTATYANGFSEVVTEGITWGDDLTDHKVAATGTVLVTATVGGVTSAAYGVAIEVSTKALVSIALSADEFEVYQGMELPKPTVTATYSEGEPEDVTALAEFTGYNKNTPGEQTITVSYSFGTGDPIEETYTVTVKPIYNVELAASVAKGLIETAVGETESTEDMIVRGIVSYINNASNNVQTYWISDDGTRTNEVEIYKGKYLSGANFTTTNQLKVGDEVVVKGKVVYYNSTTPEFANGKSQLQSLARTPNFEVEAVTGFEVGTADLAVADLTITQDGEGEVTLASSDKEEFVTIEGGKLHAVAPGTATITANLDADGIYKAKTATFSVTVIAAQVKYAITFDSNGADGGEAPEAIANKAAGAEVTLPANAYTKTGHTFDGWKVIYVDGESVEHEVTISENAFTMPAFAVTIQAQWAEISPWASVYTSNVTLTGAKVKFYGEETEYDAVKAGTGSAAGSTTITVPAQATKVHFHAYGWNTENVGLTVTAPAGVTVSPATEISINKNSGIASNSPFTLAEGSTPMTDAYYVVELSGNTTETTLTFSATTGKRFVLFGVNQEGGIVPELDHIVVTGTATALEYEVGDVFNPAGLGANAIYTLGSVEQEPVAIDAEEIEWSFEPATIAANTTAVTVTAKYEGKSATKEVSGLTVNVPEPEIIVSAASLAFGNKAKGVAVDDKELTVTLKSVENATLAITGDGASAFSVTPALTTSGTVAVSASTDNVGTFNATLTISDDADVAEAKTVALSITVEASDDISGTWNLVTDAAELMPGMQVIVASVADNNGDLYTLGGPRGNNGDNRLAVAGIASGNVLTPAAGTKVLTLVDAGDGKYALQLVNGNYLYAASSSSNYLKEKETLDANGTWSISISEGKANIVAQGTNTRNTIRHNSNSGSILFSCYASGQQDVVLYAKPFDYSREIAQGVLSTTCLPNGGQIFGASVFEIAYMDYEADGTTPHKIYFDEVEGGIMEAGMPYVVLANEGSAKFGVYYTDNENKAAQSKNGLVGYIGTGRSLVENEYFIYDNKFFYVSADDATRGRILISNNRAFINLSQVPGFQNEPVVVPAPGRRRVSLGNGASAPAVATGMENVQGDNVQSTKVLINGQLFILRGEKMYDATGRLVK